MSVGTSTKTLTVTQSSKSIAVTGTPVWFRNLVTATIAGHTGHNPNNLLLLVYRGGELVAFAEDFAGSDSSCSGTLDLNTSELEGVFLDVAPGAIRELDIFLYDSDPTSLDMLGMGVLKIYGTRDYSEATPLPPISATTVFIGSFAFYNGKTYIRSASDGLYYEFAAYGTGQQVTESLGTAGITIPGAP